MRKVQYVSSTGTAFDLMPSSGAGLQFDEFKGFECEPGETIGERDWGTVVSFIDRADADALMASAMYDIKEEEPGRLIIDDWYMPCWLNSFSTDADYGNIGVMLSMGVLSRRPYWHRSHSRSFVRQETGGSVVEEIDDERNYNRNYAYNYPKTTHSTIGGGTVSKVVSPALCDVRITFEGPVLNPSIRIGSNTYAVNVDVPAGSVLVIDSTAKGERGRSIYVKDSKGSQINVFGKRARGLQGSGNYVFERVKPGEQSVAIASSCGVTLELIECREWLPWSL